MCTLYSYRMDNLKIIQCCLDLIILVCDVAYHRAGGII